MQNFRVGSISWEKRPQGLDHYRQLVSEDLREIAEQGGELVVLPGNNGDLFQGEMGREPGYSRWYEEHASLAQDYGIIMVPGSISSPGGLGRETAIFDVRGNCLGVQKEIGKGTDAVIRTWSVKGRVLGLVLGKDLYYPEYGRCLAGMGVDLVLAPLLGETPRGGWRWELSGLWREVQQNQFWGIEAAWGLRSGAIFGPCEATSDRTGILARGWGAITALLEEEKMKEARKSFPVLDQLNPELVREYLRLLKEGPPC